MTTATPEKLLTVTEIARLLDVAQMTVYRLIEDKKLPAFRISPRVIRVDPRDFADYMRGAHTWSGAA